MQKQKKILVTGSSGQLGAAIVSKLTDSGYQVIGVDIRPASTTSKIINILNSEYLKPLMDQVEAVIHSAAIHEKHYALNYPRDLFIKTNIEGTYNLLNLSLQSGIKKLIYISSTSIYGKSLMNQDRAVWVNEELVIEPRDIYDITKQTAENLCRDFFEKDGLQTVSLRVSRFLPEDEELKANHRLYRGIDERDAAQGVRLAMEKQFKAYDFFNISSQSPFNQSDLIQLKHNPKDVILSYFPEAERIYAMRNWRFPNEIDRVYSIEKAKMVLGYRPVYNFKELLV
jgi:UDP-glucose 4-epimerase